MSCGAQYSSKIESSRSNLTPPPTVVRASADRRNHAANRPEGLVDAVAAGRVQQGDRIHAVNRIDRYRFGGRVVVARVSGVGHRLQDTVDLVDESRGHAEIPQGKREREMVDGDEIWRRGPALGVAGGPDVRRRDVTGARERVRGVRAGRPRGGVGE